MTAQRPILDWIFQLPEPQMKKAISNMLLQRILPTESSDSMHDALANAFKWDATPEKHSYWERIQKGYFKEETK